MKVDFLWKLTLSQCFLTNTKEQAGERRDFHKKATIKIHYKKKKKLKKKATISSY